MGSAMDSVDTLRRLVGFDTTSRNSNLELIHWAAEVLETAGARIRLSHDDGGGKANLLASLGPDREGGIVLSGHTDVVPVDGQAWSSDPFVLTERDGRLHGRGTADMKGFIAAALAAARGWTAEPLRRPIHLALSYDEEVGCLGVPRLLADLARHVARPALAVIGEPTGMRIGDRHRGFHGYQTVFHGQAAHSSDPAQGRDAIGPAAAFVQFLLSDDFRGTEAGDPATVNVGRIDGGTAINIVPCRCAVTWEFRTASHPAAGLLSLRAARFLADRAPRDIGVETQTVAVVPALSPEPEEAALRLVRAFGGEMPTVALPFGTEAGLFQQAGIPALVCGPGAIAQAHQPDEWIARSELAKADRFMAAVGRWASGGQEEEA